MTYTGQNLVDWKRQLEVYILDQRPLNLEEMRNLQDVIRQAVFTTGELLDHIHAKQISSWMIQNCKSAIGK